jgi:hypothetical protein
MTDARLTEIRDLIQVDVGRRGLATDPHDNLLTACADDFAAACRCVAEVERARVVVVTGFYIAHAQPPCGETDGPLGALFLARALVPLGIEVALATDRYCTPALRAGLDACGLAGPVNIFDLDAELLGCLRTAPTHLVALERVGPSHTAESVAAQVGATAADVAAFEKLVTLEQRDRCYSLRGRDLTAHTAPAHRLFELAAIAKPPIRAIGIGDGGNEIGMGKIRWDTIRRNMSSGGLIACRVPTDHLIVCGVSNWGAYGLAAGVRLLRSAPRDPALFDVDRERGILEKMVRGGPLVDGLSGKQEPTVDGISFDDYAAVLSKLEQILSAKGGPRP